jgi:hypothetical protein
MRLWADVYNTAGARLGGGPVALRSASVTRVLDGIGSINVTVPGTDARAINRLQNESICRIYYEATEGATVRELGRGALRRITASGSPSDWSLVADGPDDLDGLTRVSTKLRRTYSADSVSTIASDLVALVSGWSVSASGGNTTDARFDGVNVFKALLALAEQQGLHVRAGTSAKTVEIGAFGSASGLRLINPMQAHHSLEDADEVALIETISVEKNSEAVCNRLYPIGAGIGEAWLTILAATRNTPYTRNVVSVNGIDQHFLEHAASIAAYGVIEKMGRFGDIAPLSNSVADGENAANALYDAAAAWLTRYAVRQDAYRVTVKKVRTTVRPGDTVRLVYNGIVVRDGAVVNYLDIDGDFWVMECTERMGVEGAALDLVLSSIDRHAANGAQVVIGALEELQVDGVTVKPYFNVRSYVYDRLIDIFNPASIPVRFTNATQKLNRCLLKIRTGPFISTVAPDVTNTTHKHDVITSTTYAGPYYWRAASMLDRISGDAFNVLLPISVATASFAGRTGVESAEDFITVDYGLHEDTATPEGVRVYVNGVDYTTALGGSWFPSGGENTVELDITSAILDFTLQQEHIVQIQCTGGQGTVEAQIEIYETIQSIAV